MKSKFVRASFVTAGLLVLSAPTTVMAQDATTEPTTTEPTATETPTTEPTTTTTVVVPGSDPITTTEPAPETVTSEAPEAALTDGEAVVEGLSEAPTTVAPPPTTSDSTAETVALTDEPTAEQATEQEVTITITSPIDGATVPVDEPVEVTGTVTIGVLGTGVSIVYVVDTSGSTSADGGDCNGDGTEDVGDDLNGDGAPGQIIDCEIAGVQELEQQLAPINADIETGLVSFTSGASAETGFGDPGRTELDDAVTALDSGGGTSFNSALTAMNTLFDDAKTGNRKIGYLFTDGFSSVSDGPGSPLAAAIDAGIVVNTFSVGTGAVGCGPTSPLTAIADATGGECIQVDDPSDLTAVLEGLRPAGIEKVEISLNGGPPVEADVDLLGNFKQTVTGIVVGPNTITATVTTTEQQTASDEVIVNAEEVASEPPVPSTTAASSAASSAAPAAGATLPRTGSSPQTMVYLASGLVLAGMLALAATRRARTSY